MNKICFVVPAYNESKCIGNVVKEIISAGFACVVIDDCSIDETSKIAYENGATVLLHPINLGQGAALQTGIEYCLAQNYEFFVTFDADGQHQIEDACSMIDIVMCGSCDVALGSRFLGKKSINIKRSKIITLKLAAIFNRVLYGIKLTDAHNGLRAFNKHVAGAIKIKQNKMAHASEMLGQLRSFRIKEMPVTITYTDYSTQKGQKLTGAISILFDLFVGRFFR